MADPTGSDSNGGTTTVVSNPPNAPTTNTVPNTTTNTTTVQFQNAATKNEVLPQSNPTQFPAYDDEGNLLPGYDLDENNNPVFAGQRPPTTKAAVDTNNGGEGFGLGTPDNNGGFVNAQGDPVDANGMPIAGVPPTIFSAPLADPYAGLSPTQLQDLGGADPTDPYIRARLGIPQLPGSTLIATSGFGFGNLTTNFPSIDNALGTIRSLFSSTIGSLFGNTTVSNTAATTGSGVAALVAPVNTFTTKDTAGILAAEDAQLAEQAAAQGDAKAFGKLATSPVSNTTLNADQADAYYNGTGTLTADQRIAQDQQTAADAAALYPGTDNTNLKNIDAAGGAIARNQVGISNAEQIIAEQNQELADPNISDQRRAELEANNASQENYIRLANDNTAEQELVIEANADGYAAGGGNTDSGQGPGQVAALVDPGLQPDFVTDAEQIATRDRIAVDQAQDFNTNEDPFEASRLEAEQNLANQEPADTNLDVDPLTDDQLAVQEAFQQDQRDQLASENFVEFPPPVDANNTGEGFGNVFPDGFGGFVNGDGQPTDANGSLIPTGDNLTQSAALVDPGTGGEGFSVTPDGDGGYTDAAGNPVDQFGMPVEAVQPTTYPPAAVDPLSTGYITDSEQITAAAIDAGGATDSSLGAAGETLLASRTANAKNLAQKQATIQARFKQPGNKDWRVRLSLGPGAQYLYNATPAGVLKPLAANGGTDGVIFPYTPNITTTYSANYEQYDLTHSNYRGIFYKNSRVGDIQLRGTFTAQDTDEANYLLAVIHFFRSVTKMFYGQDDQRGTPPPICLLNGYGGYQFSDHPVVVSAFNYSLPNDVDYIRTTNPNNFGLNLNNRYNPSGVSLPAGGALAGLNRLLNAIPGGLSKGALPRTPAPNTVVGSVTNNVPASYVPTKMEIDITLIPVQTRSQVSQQFSLKGFANGDLLKGGFW